MTLMRELTPEFVDSFPAQMTPGVLYVSIPYKTTGHLCCCGCGNEVIAPLGPAQWVLTYDGDTVSLHPSIGNWALDCRAHYVIRRSKVLPARTFTQKEIAANRDRDRRTLDNYYDPHEVDLDAAVEAIDDDPAGGRSVPLSQTAPARRGWWSTLLRRRR